MGQYNHKPYILEIYGREPENMDELAQCVIKVINEQHKVIGFAWNIQYHSAISNSHSCPVDGERNFGQCETKPRSYPGWRGRVWIRYEGAISDASTGFNKTLTHTGTGGVGHYSGPFREISNARYKKYGNIYAENLLYPRPSVFSWEYRIYDSDWPLITESLRIEDTFNKLAGVDLYRTHQFKWEDPETVKKDLKFIALCALAGIG